MTIDFDFSLFAVGLSIISFGLTSNDSRAQVDDSEFLINLEIKDQDYLSPPGNVRLTAGYTESCRVYPLLRKLGMVTNHCSASWTEDTRAIAILSTYKEPPLFVSRNDVPRGGWHDKEGNCVLWRPVERYGLSTQSRNELLDKQVMYRINTQGEVVEETPWTILYRYPVGDTRNIYQLRQFLLAVGRGVAGRLNGIDWKATLPVIGLEKFVGPGSYGRGLSGEWEVSVDPKADFLVREAVFIVPGMNTPSIRTSSKGVVTSNGLSIGSQGVFDYRTDKKTFVVIEFSRVDSSAPDPVLEQVTARLASPLPPNESEIIDYREGNPDVTTRILE